jgi:Uma2 family endonuclease
MVATRAAFDEPMSEAEYRRFALADAQGWFELVDGRLRENPPISIGHRRFMSSLGFRLQRQVDRGELLVDFGHTRLRTPTGRYFVPSNNVVIPIAYDTALGRDEESLDAFAEPMPLVVDVWSPSTGAYDTETRLPEYRGCRNLEVWHLYPHKRTRTTWLRQPDGSYLESRYSGGGVRPAPLPDVAIDLDALFES